MKAVRLMAVMLIAGGVVYGGYIGYRSQALLLGRVEVIGNKNSSADELVNVSGLRKGLHLFHISTRKVARRVESIPWVKTARVERIIPSKVRIIVSERRVAASVVVGFTEYLTDRTGVVLQEGKNAAVRITGLPIQTISPGNVINVAAFRHVFLIMDSLPQRLRDSVTSVDATSVDRITLNVADETSILYGAAEQLKDKNFAVSALIEKYRAEGRKLVSIDVRVPARPAVRAA